MSFQASLPIKISKNFLSRWIPLICFALFSVICLSLLAAPAVTAFGLLSESGYEILQDASMSELRGYIIALIAFGALALFTVCIMAFRILKEYIIRKKLYPAVRKGRPFNFLMGVIIHLGTIIVCSIFISELRNLDGGTNMISAGGGIITILVFAAFFAALSVGSFVTNFIFMIREQSYQSIMKKDLFCRWIPYAMLTLFSIICLSLLAAPAVTAFGLFSESGYELLQDAGASELRGYIFVLITFGALALFSLYFMLNRILQELEKQTEIVYASHRMSPIHFTVCIIVYLGTLITCAIFISKLKDFNNGVGMISAGGGIIAILVFASLFTVLTVGLFITNFTFTKLVIPNGTTEIPPYAYYNCVKLQSIDIPNSIEYLAIGVFYKCFKLINIRYQGTIEQWNAVKKHPEWNKYTNNYTVYCTDGELQK